MLATLLCRYSKKMKNNIYGLICLVTFALSLFMFLWSKHFTEIEIETNEWKGNSLTKYEFFISRLKQSGEPSVLYY